MAVSACYWLQVKEKEEGREINKQEEDEENNPERKKRVKE